MKRGFLICIGIIAIAVTADAQMRYNPPHKKAILITTHEKPVSVLLPIEDYEALIETMDLLANPTAMRTLRAAKAGKLKYRRLNLDDEDFGL